MANAPTAAPAAARPATMPAENRDPAFFPAVSIWPPVPLNSRSIFCRIPSNEGTMET